MTSCYFEDFFPVVPVGQNGCHAAMWLIGPGVQDVDVIDTEVVAAHDAIEIEGVEDLASGFSTTASLDVVDCFLHDIENGVEVVGVGQLQFSVTGSQFLRCNNLPQGIDPQVSGLAGVFIRAMDGVNGTVRDCEFRDNSYGVAVNLSPSMSSTIDLGRECDLGGNVFHPYDWTISPSEDFYRVHVFQGGQVGSAGIVPQLYAWGNTWIPSMQGVDAFGQKLQQELLFGPFNLVNGEPPGPFAGPAADRNYSVRGPTAPISFGEDCP